MTQLTYDLTELGDVSPAIPPLGFMRLRIVEMILKVALAD